MLFDEECSTMSSAASKYKMMSGPSRSRRKRRRLVQDRLVQDLLYLLGIMAILSMVPHLYHSLGGTTRDFIANNALALLPSTEDGAVVADGSRQLSVNLGGGKCKWQPPEYNPPENIDFHKTIIAGFPSGDKRMIFLQMEALTGWPAKDEWDFEYLGPSNHPFIKANYPHHEGIWGWGEVADQVVMMVRNIRRSMVEYHDILWDIGYSETWEDVSTYLDQLYGERPPMEDFLIWRDMRVMEECAWYGWFIDYWMEGGLMRDIYTHKLTTPEHWNMLMVPTGYSRDELDFNLNVGQDTVVTASYDPHCAKVNGDVTDGCEPVAVISGEKLRDYTDGPGETAKIAVALRNDDRTGKYVIEEEAWDCIWEELIPNGKGAKTVYDRPGFVEADYNFSQEMLEEMINELNRLITKYGSDYWKTSENANRNANANRIVELLSEHRASIQIELNEVKSGVRLLTEKDFLGPKERRRLKAEKEKKKNGKDSDSELVSSKVDSSGRQLEAEDDQGREHTNFYFNTFGKLLEKRQRLQKKKIRLQKRRREMRIKARRARSAADARQ